ncbi:MAG: ABC transporter ATP-binding protein [Oscillospiraceae bacterium]|nr:ABC transporter ATP-binding protein [Oscillospiraceae bacterium]
MQEYAIELRHVSKSFPAGSVRTQLKDLFFLRDPSAGRHTVLHGIDLRVSPGEAVGLVGRNGCGKSTVLKLVSRILCPDEGSITLHGRVSALLELGAGFHPDLTGRENLRTNAAVFGLTRVETDRRMDSIIRFSELGRRIDDPVRTYSSGMYMRLAFSVAVHVDSDILLIDEILAVGDAAFQEKCFARLQEIRRSGTAILLVSHDTAQLRAVCDRCVWLQDGTIRAEGSPERICGDYAASQQLPS